MLGRRALSVRRLALLAAVLSVGCGGTIPPIARTIDGERHVGVFVSPYAYESFIRAELAAASGDDEQAVELYLMARAGAQDDAYVAARQAGTLVRLGRLEEAERVLMEADAIEPRTTEIWLARGALRLAREDAEGAMDAYVRAAMLAPHSPEPVLRIAERLREGGAAGRALAVLAEGNERHPAVLRARLALALERGDAAAAASAAEALAERVPLALPDVLAAARAALDANRPALAAQLLAHPAVLSAPDAVPLRVRALLAQGETEAAEALTLATAPESLGGRGVQARLLLDAGQAEMARDLAALGLSLSEPGAATALGWARLELEGPGAAAAAFAREPRPERATEGIGAALRLAGLGALASEVSRP